MHQEQQQAEQMPGFRLDVPLHDLLTKSTAISPGLSSSGKPQKFPDPVFPQHPELLGPIDEAGSWAPPEKRNWRPGQIYHAMQGWLFPYIRWLRQATSIRSSLISLLSSNVISTATTAGPLTTKSGE